jgi:uncharacterized phosphatase
VRRLLIRHAESAGNAAGIIQGHADFPLSERGRMQAELLARRLGAAQGIDALYSSPLSRAYDTARAIAVRTGHAIRALESLREYDFGQVNGMPLREALDRFGATPDPSGGTATFPVYPGEEGREEFRCRVCDTLLGLEAEHGDATVTVVTHGGPITVFCLAMLEQPYRPRPPFNVYNASITSIDVRNGRGTIYGLNDTCHLDELVEESP